MPKKPSDKRAKKKPAAAEPLKDLGAKKKRSGSVKGGGVGDIAAGLIVRGAPTGGGGVMNFSLFNKDPYVKSQPNMPSSGL